MKDNLYIKNINYEANNNVGLWIYKVNNIAYHIKNTGYLLLIDSKFNKDKNIRFNHTESEYKYKIYGDIFKDNRFDRNTIKRNIFKQFAMMVDPDNFTTYLKVQTASIQLDSVLRLIKSIFTSCEKDRDANDCDLKKILFENFSEFLHPRIGTYLTVEERDYILYPLKDNVNSYRGRLIVYQERYDKFIWALVTSINEQSPPIFTILVSSPTKSISQIDVHMNALRDYPVNKEVNIMTSPNPKMDQQSIQETYNLYTST